MRNGNRLAVIGVVAILTPGCATFFQPAYKPLIFEKAVTAVNTLAKIQASLEVSAPDYLPYDKVEPLFVEAISSAIQARIEATARADAIAPNQPSKVPARTIATMTNTCLSSIKTIQIRYKAGGDGSNAAARYPEPEGDVEAAIHTCQAVAKTEALFKD